MVPFFIGIERFVLSDPKGEREAVRARRRWRKKRTYCPLSKGVLSPKNEGARRLLPQWCKRLGARQFGVCNNQNYVVLFRRTQIFLAILKISHFACENGIFAK